MATPGTAPQQLSPLEQPTRRIAPPNSTEEVRSYDTAIVATYHRRCLFSPVAGAASVTGTLERWGAVHWRAASDGRDAEMSTPVQHVEDGYWLRRRTCNVEAL